MIAISIEMGQKVKITKNAGYDPSAKHRRQIKQTTCWTNVSFILRKRWRLCYIGKGNWSSSSSFSLTHSHGIVQTTNWNWQRNCRCVILLRFSLRVPYQYYVLKFRLLSSAHRNAPCASISVSLTNSIEHSLLRKQIHSPYESDSMTVRRARADRIASCTGDKNLLTIRINKSAVPYDVQTYFEYLQSWYL